MSCADISNTDISTEPQATFWTGPECGGRAMKLAAGVYFNLQGARLTGPEITGLWCPPHQQILLWTSEGCVGEAQLTIWGNQRVVNLSQPDLGVGAGKIRSMKIIQTAPWSDFKLKCCRGDSDVTQAECQSYWGPGGAGNCDTLMANWCRQNPWEPVCFCLTSEAKDIAPCVDPKCINGAAFQNSNQRRILAGKCPNKTICEQKIILGAGATDNIIRANMYQICGSVAPPTPPVPVAPPAVPLAGNGSMWIILLILVIFAAFLEVSFGGEKSKIEIRTPN